MRLLAIDWDFFMLRLFEAREDISRGLADQLSLYDWAHTESDLFLGPIWTLRAADFLRRGLPLPGLTDTQPWQLWDRLPVSADATVYVAESNASAVNYPGTGDIDDVWLFDAHHDCGYADDDVLRGRTTGNWECGSWMVPYHDHGASLHVRYPAWRDVNGESDPYVPVDQRVFRGHPDDLPTGPADVVFICRSGAWMPPWLDTEFLRFVHACPADELCAVDDDWSDPMTPRFFNIAEAVMIAEQTDRMLRQVTPSHVTRSQPHVPPAS